MTASYWEIGRRIVEFEQGGQERAGRGQQLLQRLSADLQQRFGRGFSVDNLEQMRLFYLAFSSQHIAETLSRKSPAAGEAEKSETASRNISLEQLALALPLSWSHYVHLVRGTCSTQEREFYEAEALRCGWSVRQLDRQKTVTAAAIIARRGVNTWLLVHRTELLKQWQERLQAFLGVGKGVVGAIGGGKAKPKGMIDIAVMQSPSRQGAVNALVENYGQIMVDECPSAPNTLRPSASP